MRKIIVRHAHGLAYTYAACMVVPVYAKAVGADPFYSLGVRGLSASVAWFVYLLLSIGLLTRPDSLHRSTESPSARHEVTQFLLGTTAGMIATGVLSAAIAHGRFDDEVLRLAAAPLLLLIALVVALLAGVVGSNSEVGIGPSVRNGGIPDTLLALAACGVGAGVYAIVRGEGSVVAFGRQVSLAWLMVVALYLFGRAARRAVESTGDRSKRRVLRAGNVVGTLLLALVIALL
jgi:hypothetical protein